MKFSSFIKSATLKRVGALSVAVVLGAGLVGCGGGNASSSGSGVGDTSEGVAATIKGENFELKVGEKAVSDYIADFRESAALTEDDAWGEWLVANNYTPETVRSEVIDYYVDQMLYEQAATENGVEVTDEDVNNALEETKSMFESEDAYTQALEQSNLTEDTYKETVLKPNLLQEKLAEAVANTETEGDSDQLLTLAQEYSTQFDGAKKSSHILFAAEDEKTAKQVLKDLKDGKITFEDAAKQYSTDTSSAEDGGNVGWDKLTTFVQEYQDALAKLDKDAMSDLVKSEYGYHIIKVTDEFKVPEDGITSVDQLPEEFVEYLNYMQSSEASQNFSTWFAAYKEAVTITVEDMPEGLPYAIDLTAYQNAVSGADGEATQDEQEAADADQNAAAEETEASNAAETAGDTAAAEADQEAANADKAAAEAEQELADQGEQAAEGEAE